jgi:hypothetical protein
MCFREMHREAMDSKRIYVEAADCCNDRDDEDSFTLAHVVQNFNQVFSVCFEYEDISDKLDQESANNIKDAVIRNF